MIRKTLLLLRPICLGSIGQFADQLILGGMSRLLFWIKPIRQVTAVRAIPHGNYRSPAGERTWYLRPLLLRARATSTAPAQAEHRHGAHPSHRNEIDKFVL